MDGTTTLLFAILILLAAAAALAWYLLMPASNRTNVRTLMQQKGVRMGRPDEEAMALQAEQLKMLHREKAKQIKVELTLEEKFFQAGMFSDDEKKDFKKLRVMLPCGLAFVGLVLGLASGGIWVVVAPAVLAAVGYQAPVSVLDRKILARQEEIVFFLPLVIEQIVIGVSSSLDVGPCLQRVVAMAEERDSHNPVTELIRHAQLYMKSGVSLEEAMIEVGKLSGNNELKHAFMSLSQVAKHGGEITKQLQELADAVGAQREAAVEAKIKKLELAATGPVGLVFMGFLLILLMGFGQQIMKAFQ